MLEKLKEVKETGIRNIVGEKIEEIKEVGLLPAIKAKVTGIRRVPTELSIEELEKIGPTPEEVTAEAPTPTPTGTPTKTTKLKGGV